MPAVFCDGFYEKMHLFCFEPTDNIRMAVLSLVGPLPDSLLFRRFDELLTELRVRDADHKLRPLPRVSAGQVDFALIGDDEVGHGTRRRHDFPGGEVRLDIAVELAVLVFVSAVHAKERFFAFRLIRAFDEIDLSSRS